MTQQHILIGPIYLKVPVDDSNQAELPSGDYEILKSPDAETILSGEWLRGWREFRERAARVTKQMAAEIENCGP